MDGKPSGLVVNINGSESNSEVSVVGSNPDITITKRKNESPDS